MFKKYIHQIYLSIIAFLAMIVLVGTDLLIAKHENNILWVGINYTLGVK